MSSLRPWNEYVQVVLDKVATISVPVLNGKATEMYTIKHRDLNDYLKNCNIVTFDYCFGQESRRLKQIQSMGYRLEYTVWRNTDAKWSRIKQIWVR